MADEESNIKLAHDTAAALLTAIKAQAPDAANRGTDALRSLAEAYSLVRETLPKPGGRLRSH